MRTSFKTFKGARRGAARLAARDRACGQAEELTRTAECGARRARGNQPHCAAAFIGSNLCLRLQEGPLDEYRVPWARAAKKEQQRAPSKSVKWLRRYGFSMLFLVIAGLFVFGALRLLPSDTPTYTPKTVGISDVVSSDPVRNVLISVSTHGADYEVDITVITNHPRSTGAGNTVGLNLHLPEPPNNSKCHVDNCLNEGAGQGHVVLLQARSYPLEVLPAQSIGKPPSQPSTTLWAADLYATVVGPGFAFDANGVTAEAELPSVSVTATVLMPVTVDYEIPGAASYDWGGTPTYYFPLQNHVQWQESSSDAMNPIVVDGVDHAAQSRENTNIFIAGILLGLCGGALVAAIQELRKEGS